MAAPSPWKRHATVENCIGGPAFAAKVSISRNPAGIACTLFDGPVSRCCTSGMPGGQICASVPWVVLDCLSCGACCYGPDDYVSVSGPDRDRMTAQTAARYVV